MLGLTKIEKTALVIIFAALFGLMSISYGNSLRKARDVQRKSDIQDIANALEKFQKVFSYYPQSVNGKIVGCNPQKDTTGGINLSVCEWGKGQEYFPNLPEDPFSSRGRTYYYVSSGTRYQLFTSLESKEEAEYNEAINKRNLSCGNSICNFGLASGDTPLTKTIEEYEYELKVERDRIQMELDKQTKKK